jgi:hypothetical protein
MQFYRLEQPKVDSAEGRAGVTDSVKEEGNNVGDAVRCPTCNRPLSMLQWLPPYRVELESWGTHYADIVEIGNDLIVSERFMRDFVNNDLKGLPAFEPVTIVKVVHRRAKPAGQLPGYIKAPVIRSTTTIDQKASGYIWEDESQVCQECLYGTLKRYRRLIVKADTWSGEDVFFPRGGHGPIVSERFKSVFFQNDLRGAVFIPCESDEAGYDSFPRETNGNRNRELQ